MHAHRRLKARLCVCVATSHLVGLTNVLGTFRKREESMARHRSKPILPADKRQTISKRDRVSRHVPGGLPGMIGNEWLAPGKRRKLSRLLSVELPFAERASWELAMMHGSEIAVDRNGRPDQYRQADGSFKPGLITPTGQFKLRRKAL